jgi:hypothetical protein
MARLLLVLHAVLGFLSMGLAVHALIWSWQRRVRAVLFARLAALVTAAQVVIGLLVYPVYRVKVRHEIFDVRHPDGGMPLGWLGRLFDIKEHFGLLGLVLLVLAWWLCTRGGERASRTERAAQLGAAGLGAGLIWVAGMVGVLVTSYAGLGRFQ